MAREIRLLADDDLPELGRFLTTGFRTPPEAEFAASEVLRWKYLEPCGEEDEAPRSYLARDEHGRIIGHVGISLTAFEGDQVPGGRVGTLHMMDWLGSPEHRSIGTSLMRTAYCRTPTQFGLGGSGAARVIGKPTGYADKAPVPVYQRVLNPLHWLRDPSLGVAARATRLARDLARSGVHAVRPGGSRFILRRIETFGTEIEPVVAGAKTRVIVSSRRPARLNHLLRFPRQAMSGWLLSDRAGQVHGFAVLNLIPRPGGRVVLGKVVDCLLAETDAELWRQAIAALTQELKRQGADLVQTFASTPWMESALRQSGFRSRFSLEFQVRDRQGLLPAGPAYHLMPIEADYAHT